MLKIKSILNIVLFFALQLASQYAKAQDSNYSILYNYKDSFGVELESLLLVNGDESYFSIIDERDSGMQYDEEGNFDHFVTNDKIGTIMYTNNQDVYVRIPFPEVTKGTTYKYNTEDLPWNLTGNTKVIKKFNCQEATLNFHGRNYRVWFSSEIPISKGPFNLNGLPGVIVSFEELTGKYAIDIVSVKKNGGEKMKDKISNYFNSNKVKTYSAYQKFMKQYILDMKIKKAQQISELIKKEGGTISFDFDLGQYHWVSKIIDIPTGLIEELAKIDFYEN